MHAHCRFSLFVIARLELPFFVMGSVCLRNKVIIIIIIIIIIIHSWERERTASSCWKTEFIFCKSMGYYDVNCTMSSWVRTSLVVGSGIQSLFFFVMSVLGPVLFVMYRPVSDVIAWTSFLVARLLNLQMIHSLQQSGHRTPSNNWKHPRLRFWLEVLDDPKQTPAERWFAFLHRRGSVCDRF